MNKHMIAALAAVAGLLLLLSLSLFTVSETEFAVRTRFGQVQNGSYAPGRLDRIRSGFRSSGGRLRRNWCFRQRRLWRQYCRPAAYSLRGRNG